LTIPLLVRSTFRDTLLLGVMSWDTAATTLKSWSCWLWNWNSYLRSCRIPHFSRQKFFCFFRFSNLTVEWTKWNHVCWGPRKLSILDSFLVFPRPVNFPTVEWSSVGMKNSQKLSSKTSSETRLLFLYIYFKTKRLRFYFFVYY
jgi:hypothetical protein